MTSKEEKLVLAKEKLLAALGDKSVQYFANMKMWFRKKWTIEQFYQESQKLFTPETMHCHNQFFLAFISKVVDPTQSLTDANNSTASLSLKNAKKRKRSSRTTSDRSLIESIETFDYLPEESAEFTRPPSTPGTVRPSHLPQQRFAAKELFLPDNGLVMGRFMLGAWEADLSGAEDNVCEIITVAVQVLLKNILTSVILNKKHCRITGGGSYFYDIGHTLKDPSIRNTLSRQQIDDAPIDIDKTVAPKNLNREFLSACEQVYPTPKRRITILDLYKALRDKNIIPVHSVHAINVERISQMLH